MLYYYIMRGIQKGEINMIQVEYPKYDAFISYTHKELDNFVAETLHKKIERYRIPRKLRKTSGKSRFSRVFRDREELSVSSDLSENICKALQNSEYLIVLCSPAAKESIWVQREIEYFLEYHDREHILTVLLQGEPSESFPQILCERKVVQIDRNGEKRVSKEILEPLAADVRGASKREVYKKCRTEFLRLIAVMLGCSYDALKQRHREYVMKRVVAVLGLGLVLSIGFAIYAVNQRNQIHLQYQQAQKNQARYLSEKANQQMDEGDRIGALSTVLQVTPEDDDATEAVVPEQMYVLNRTLYTYQHSQQYIYRPTGMMEQEGLNTESNGFNQNGNMFFCLDDLGNACFYDTKDQSLLWKTAAQKLDEDETGTFLWGYFFDQAKVVLATTDKYYILNINKKNCEKKIKSDVMNDKEQISTIHDNILAVSCETDEYVYLYDLKQGREIKKLSCNGLKNEILEEGNTISAVTFSEDGKKLAVGVKQNTADKDSDSLFVFDCASGNMLTSFLEDSIAAAEFVGTDKLAVISYASPKNNPFSIMDYEYEYENRVLDLNTKRALWHSERYRDSSQFNQDPKGIKNIGSFTINTDTAPVLLFYNQKSFTTIDTNQWDVLREQTFDGNIVNIEKIDENNLLIGISNGKIYRSTLATYSTVVTMNEQVSKMHYDVKSDTLVQIAFHNIVFLKKPMDESMSYYGAEIPSKVEKQAEESELDETMTVKGKKYKAQLVDRNIIVTSSDDSEKILAQLPVSDESVLFNFITEKEYLIVYDSGFSRIFIWDIEKLEMVTDQSFDLESSYKSQLIIDEKNSRFALNLGSGSAIVTDNGTEFRCLDIFTWDDDFQIYHFASVPYGDVDFSNNKIYCSTHENDKSVCYVSDIYNYSELRKRAENVIQKGKDES